MTRLGKVYGGLMVDMRADQRQAPPARRAHGRDDHRLRRRLAAAAALADADGDVKLAALLARADAQRTHALLDKHDGNLRAAIAEGARALKFGIALSPFPPHPSASASRSLTPSPAGREGGAR